MIGAGIAIALLAAVADGFSLVLQASEARQAPAGEGMRFKLLWRLARRRRWLNGTALMIAVWPLQVLALTFAPITVVQPTLSTSQLVLLGMARVKLGERVGRYEALGALAIVVGLAGVVWASPRHTVVNAGAARLAAPMALVGAAAVAAYAFGRREPRARLPLVIGAGLAYAWTDFVNKLLANATSSGDWALATLWVVAAVLFGGVAFLEENSALQRAPAVTVAPVIGALKEPLPVLMALWAGVEAWGGSGQRIGVLVGGLALVAAGAVRLGRSKTVALVASGDRSSLTSSPDNAALRVGGGRGSRCLL